jgi:hypothetical protein
MTIDDSARRLGALVWTERRLFEILGGWVQETPEAAVKVTFARVSRHHGEHAVAVASLLPATREHDPEASVHPEVDAEAAVAVAAACGSTAERLHAVTDRVGAGHLRALAAYLADAAPVRDAPGIRVVSGVLEEVRADLGSLEALRRRGDR